MKLHSPTKMAFSGPPRNTMGILRYFLLAAVAIGLIYYMRNSTLGERFHHNPSQAQTPQTSNLKVGGHPIDELIAVAESDFAELLKKESKDLKSAAAAYRTRRGRHPPPGFDAWFEFAKQNGAIVVEEFFDQLHHDIGPYWGELPATMRRDTSMYEMTIKIRNGTATAGSDWFWTVLWLDLIKTIEVYLPDMDIALNAMDEPRILVPWEKINEFMEKERASRKMLPPNEVISQYQSLALEPDADREPQKLDWEDKSPFWKIAIRGCPPDSLARKSVQMTDYSHTPDISLKHALPFTYKGYISNFTASADFCDQPDIQSLHGMMIRPLSVKSTKTFLPMFGGSKLSTNNEILLPAPMYWSGERRFTGGEDHGPSWAQKEDKVIWRGVATGGKNTADNWKGFQRHRFVAQTNGTEISNVENWKQIPQNWAMPSSMYKLAAQEEGKLGEWTKSWANNAFVDLMCVESEAEKGGRCPYTGKHFAIMDGLEMIQQFACKFLPDIDGNSFSGRYRGFLMSTSLPIKATIFKEWHDSRLVPWVHFVPMDNRFMDFWGIMEYFLGYQGKERKVPSHDKEAEKIALAGQDWANKVLRKEDMQIYVFRVLLEYGRVTNDNRDKMGYVKDLL